MSKTTGSPKDFLNATTGAANTEDIQGRNVDLDDDVDEESNTPLPSKPTKTPKVEKENAVQKTKVDVNGDEIVTEEILNMLSQNPDPIPNILEKLEFIPKELRLKAVQLTTQDFAIPGISKEAEAYNAVLTAEKIMRTRMVKDYDNALNNAKPVKSIDI